MRNWIKYILFLLLLSAITFAIHRSVPKKFKWNPTFDARDKEPFGCFIFDDVASSSLKNGYRVSRQSFYQLSADSLQPNQNILCLSHHLSLSKWEKEALFQHVNDGNKVMLAAFQISFLTDKELGWLSSYHYFNLSALKKHFTDKDARDTIYFHQDTLEKIAYRYPPQICAGNFHQVECVDTLNTRVLATNSQGEPIALAFSIGRGELYLVSTPLVFTNYGVLDGDNAAYPFSLLSHIADRPIVRTEAHLQLATNDTPLRFLLSQRPLRWSLYLILTGLLLCMIFSAKRRQRIIPIVKPPINRTLVFASLVGTIYFRRKDYAGLTRKKYIYFADQLKRYTGIELTSNEPTRELSLRLAEKSGMKADRIEQLLAMLAELNRGESSITEEMMRDYIDRMNELINNIK